MVEARAVDCVYCIGQTQEVTIIRYIVPNSVEELSASFYVLLFQLEAADWIKQYVHIAQQGKTNMINQANRTIDSTEPDLTEAKKKVRTESYQAFFTALILNLNTDIRNGSSVT